MCGSRAVTSWFAAHGDSRPISIYVGEEGAAFPSAFTLVCKTSMRSARVGMESVEIALRDPMLGLDKPVYVRAYVGEPDLGRIVPGTAVRVRSDSSDKVYRGQVGFISPRAEFTPKTVETTDLRTDLVYRLRVLVEEPDEGLRQGMPVTVHLEPRKGEEP